MEDDERRRLPQIAPRLEEWTEEKLREDRERWKRPPPSPASIPYSDGDFGDVDDGPSPTVH